MHKYPKGAIQNDKELLFGFLGQTMYIVHGLGNSSCMNVVNNARNFRTEGAIRMFDYEETYHGETWLSKCCLGDVNIDNHYNHHYIFCNIEDAVAYLEYAMKHTPEIKSIRTSLLA